MNSNVKTDMKFSDFIEKIFDMKLNDFQKALLNTAYESGYFNNTKFNNSRINHHQYGYGKRCNVMMVDELDYIRKDVNYE